MGEGHESSVLLQLRRQYYLDREEEKAIPSLFFLLQELYPQNLNSFTRSLPVNRNSGCFRCSNRV